MRYHWSAPANSVPSKIFKLLVLADIISLSVAL
jgi:hypothetical protein